MGASGAPQETSISKARSLDEIAEYWDSHSLADHWDETAEVEFKVRAARRRRISLDPEVYEGVANRARIRGIRSETLVNLWQKERLQGSH